MPALLVAVHGDGELEAVLLLVVDVRDVGEVHVAHLDRFEAETAERRDTVLGGAELGDRLVRQVDLELERLAGR